MKLLDFEKFISYNHIMSKKDGQIIFYKVKSSKNVGLTFECFISAIILICDELSMDV